VLYTAYELTRRAGAPVVHASALTVRGLDALPPVLRERRTVRHARAAHEIVSRSRATHERPAFGIDSVVSGGSDVRVQERPVSATPFATLLHFAKPERPGQPRVLVVGPLSGHFTTLITPTIRTLLADHDVHVLDWHNARDIPAAAGPFGLDEYIEHVMQALRDLGPGAHVVAVCQPAVPVLAAVALLAADDDAAQPASMTLIAGPIDTRVNPNRVNEAAARRPLSWFERRVITTVPPWYRGAGRRVYPGFVQLSAFMSMNRRRHLQAHVGLYKDLVAGRHEAAKATKDFYDEYGAVLDVPAEFYLETVGRIFQEHLLAKGELVWRGRRVDPGLIRHTALLAVEGAKDDICSPGQTLAALSLCTGLPADRKAHHLQPGVGHYGVFSGSRWEGEVYPVIRAFVQAAEAADLPLAAAQA
jgi:polyhydroxyalkanoate depolymerase